MDTFVRYYKQQKASRYSENHNRNVSIQTESNAVRTPETQFPILATSIAEELGFMTEVTF